MFRLAILAAAFLAAGCVSVQHVPMNGSSAEALKDKEIALSERPRPEFAASTPGRAAFGAIGAALTISEGNKIVKEHGIEDPALYIGKTLAAELQGRYNTRLAGKSVPTDSDEAADIAKNANGADLVLDVRTINWSFVYLPTSWGRYRVIYTARLRLVEAKSGKVLAEGGCKRASDDAKNAPSYGDLLANSAARLKQELLAAADLCISEFKSKVLAL
jgi:hypothetical protein